MPKQLSTRSLLAVAALGATVAASAIFTTVDPRPAHAADCTVSKAIDDMTEADINALYGCMREKLVAGYGKSGKGIGKDYAGWKAASTRPAAPGVHGGRFLMTYVNDIGHAEYVKYSDANPKMPVGTIIAKESFKPNKKGKVRFGPLLIMTKLEAGKAPKYGDWLYAGINGKGKNFKVSQKFCHDCHGNYDDQDFLGYPDEDARIK